MLSQVCPKLALKENDFNVLKIYGDVFAIYVNQTKKWQEVFTIKEDYFRGPLEPR